MTASIDVSVSIESLGLKSMNYIAIYQNDCLNMDFPNMQILFCRRIHREGSIADLCPSEVVHQDAEEKGNKTEPHDDEEDDKEEPSHRLQAISSRQSLICINTEKHCTILIPSYPAIHPASKGTESKLQQKLS